MALIFQDQSGLGEGIQQLGGALGSVLQESKQRRKSQELQKGLINQFPEESVLGKVLRAPGGLQFIQQNASLLAPLLKEEAKAEFDTRDLNEKRNENLWNYKPTQKFIENLEESAEDAEFGNQIADEVIKLAESGNVSPSNVRNFLASQFGEKLPILFSPEAASFKMLEKLQAKGLKNIFPRPTEREFFFVNAAQAQLGKSDQANIAIANLQKKFNSIALRAAEFKDEVIRENNGNPPRDIQARVRKKMEAYRNELFNDAASIPFYYGDKKEKAAAEKFLKQNKSPIINQPKPLTQQIKLQLFEEAGRDKFKALELARERGYDVG